MCCSGHPRRPAWWDPIRPTPIRGDPSYDVRHPAPSARCCPRTGRGRFDVLGFLATAYAALLPYQFEVSHGRLNFAPADLCLPLAILLAPAYLKYRREAWSFLHI